MSNFRSMLRRKEYLYFISLFLSAVIGWTTFILILLRVDPFIAAWYEMVFFYLSLLLAHSVTFFLIGWGARRIVVKRFHLYDHIGVLWRQSFLLTALACVLLLLQSIRLLEWWNISMIILALFLFEFFFITYSRER